MAIGRRQLFGLMLGAPPALIASAAAAATPPEPEVDPTIFVQPLRIHHNRGVAGYTANAARRTSDYGKIVMADHVCQCVNCSPGLMLPNLKVLAREWVHQDGDPADMGWWHETYEPLHEGHFGVRLGRPSYPDYQSGIRLAIWVNGAKVPYANTYEAIAGPNGKVWSYTQTDGGRHSCLTCSKGACVTFYQGEVFVQVLVPEHVTPDAPLRALFA